MGQDTTACEVRYMERSCKYNLIQITVFFAHICNQVLSYRHYRYPISYKKAETTIWSLYKISDRNCWSSELIFSAFLPFISFLPRKIILSPFSQCRVETLWLRFVLFSQEVIAFFDLYIIGSPLPQFVCFLIKWNML